MITITSFIEQFQLFMDKSKSTADIVCLRSIIGSEEEALMFVEAFSKLTGTDWVSCHLPSKTNHKHRSKRRGKRSKSQRNRRMKENPNVEMFNFQNTWLCHRSWHRKSKFHSQDSNCGAKIDILLKKMNPSTFENDIYMNHKPPLHCVIHLTGKHNHDLVNDNDLQMIGLTEELKEQFFEYFQSGLSVTKAVRKHDLVLKLMKKSGQVIFKFNPTLTEMQHIYNYWKSLKSRIGSLKEKDKQEKVALKELLNAIPTMELPQEFMQTPSAFHMKSSSASKNFQSPLVFVSTGSTGALSNKSLPLLYKLKYGPDGNFMSSHTMPEIYSIVVNAPAQNSLNDQLPNPESTSGISVKIEPPDSDEDAISMISENEHVQDSSIMPVVIKAFSCKVDSLNPNASPQSLDLQNAAAGECIFPLVFTYTGLVSASTDETTPFLYVLKQGPFGLNVTPDTMPQIFSVQINSTRQANLKVNNASTLNRELPLKVCLPVERIKKEVEDVHTFSSNLQSDNEASKMPVILEVSSCKTGEKVVGLPKICDKSKSCSLIPNNTDEKGVQNGSRSTQPRFGDALLLNGQNVARQVRQDPSLMHEDTPRRKRRSEEHKKVIEKTKRRDEGHQSTTGIKKSCNSLETGLSSGASRVCVKEQELTDDDDHKFCMSLLPLLQQLPHNRKVYVKKKIQNLVIASRLCANKIEFEKRSSNIYRDCGVLPILRDWKF